MKNIICMLFAIIAVMVALIIPSSAYYASDESGNTDIPEYIESISVASEDVSIPETGDAYELTPDGNLTLIDDISTYITTSEDGSIESYSEESGSSITKQIFTVQTKAGNTFYIILDRNGTNENAYLLNLVDESDLLAIINDGEECICSEKCQNGDFNENCPVCKYDYRKCEAEEPTTIETTTEATTEEVEDDDGKSSVSPIAVILLLIALGGGFAFYWFKVRPGKDNTNEIIQNEDIDEDPDVQSDDEDEITHNTIEDLFDNEE